MIDYRVLLNQWLGVALISGLVLMLGAALTYWAVWRERQKGQMATQPISGPLSFAQWVLEFVPWVLILTVVGAAVYAVWYVVARSTEPPNW